MIGFLGTTEQLTGRRTIVTQQDGSEAVMQLLIKGMMPGVGTIQPRAGFSIMAILNQVFQ
ncbi:hypothetical protein [Marinobacter zhanjiangensis]|uniref:Uncharacterized protein n=1 Tax=Marinobacter zhanjiangensis TaxID=578215 RepID=A0ABQ3APB3_9GAMM|nr:hypothetical protein [Marinobacter zhanjiangensis]GGY63133.1 hypothetical protein GCM10007071_07080 [Marinobacter zhanjiangensis]